MSFHNERASEGGHPFDHNLNPQRGDPSLRSMAQDSSPLPPSQPQRYFDPSMPLRSSSDLGYRPFSTHTAPYYQPGTMHQPRVDMTPEARREVIMAIDRKRRLTESEHARGRHAPGMLQSRDSALSERFYTNLTQAGPRSPTAEQANLRAIHPGTEVIDLTTSPPGPAHQTSIRPHRHPSLGSLQQGFPRWQSDSEVSECPICHRQFSFLFRRHHCRKCGRVVCNDCSPHRITIPRQFIVNPPGLDVPDTSTPAGFIDFIRDRYGEEAGTGQDGNMGNGRERPLRYPGDRSYRPLTTAPLTGGEKVRLCNPCVPDPQPEPPAGLQSANPPSTRMGNYPHSPGVAANPRSSNREYMEPFPQIFSPEYVPVGTQLPRSQSLRSGPSASSFPDHDPRDIDRRRYPQHAYDHALNWAENLQRQPQRSHPIFDNGQRGHGRHFSLDTSRLPPLPVHRSRQRSMLDDSVILPASYVAPPRPQLREEDICPVCRRALPPKGEDGNEAAREAHIMDCISARDPSASGVQIRSEGESSSPIRGPMHMLTFVATEKDCVTEDGNTPECSICMVEYDVGDQLARLECLCKFHRDCIASWFTRKQECPVHKFA